MFLSGFKTNGVRTLLVLKRRRTEEIIVTSPDGTRVRIALVESDQGSARIGIEAPSDWTINRAEVQRAIEREAVKRALIHSH